MEDQFSTEDGPDLVLTGVLLQQESWTSPTSNTVSKGGQREEHLPAMLKRWSRTAEQLWQRDLGQAQRTCSLAEDDGVGDLKGNTQGRRRKAERAVQKKKKRQEKRLKTSSNPLNWAVILTGDSSGDAVLSFTKQKALRSHVNEEKRIKTLPLHKP